MGIKLNLSKFQASAAPPASAAVPLWLKRPFYVTCPVLRAEVEDAEEAAEEAMAAAKTARDDEKKAAAILVKEAAEAASTALDSVPEQHRAYYPCK